MSKLIYIANARMPTERAHGIQIMKMCEAFASCDANKVEVTLVLPWRFNHIKENSFDYYNVKKVFKIKKLPSLDLIPLGLPKIGFWIQSLSFSKWVFWYLLFKKPACARLRGQAGRPEIIYSRDPGILFFPSFLKKNLVVEVHQFPRNFFLYRRVFKKAKAIVVITKKLKELFIERGIAEDKILVAPDGVDISKFQIHPVIRPGAPSNDGANSKLQIRKKLGLPQDKKIVLYTGHLYKWKGADVLAEASKYLGQDTLVVFVGGTEKDRKIFNFQFSIFKNILLVEHKPHREIPFWLKAADVLVLPNSAQTDISQYWTSPMKLFEYMASQRPIVASDLLSIREILNQDNAVLVKPDNPQALAEGIDKVLKNPDFAVRISKQAYQDVQPYTWHERAKKILRFRG